MSNLMNPLDDPFTQEIIGMIKDRLVDGKLPCAVAFDIADIKQISGHTIGDIANLIGIKINKCQLGLFGHSPEKKTVKVLNRVKPILKEAVQTMGYNNVIKCLDVWMIGRRLGIDKLHVSGACETFGIKIKECQLGAF